MKHLLLLITICCFTLSSQAQEASKYEQAMGKNLMAYKLAETPEQYIACANKFDQIGEIERERWAPLYYGYISKIMAAFATKDGDKSDEILDAAKSHFETNLPTENEEVKSAQMQSEIMALKSMAASAKLQVAPMQRGQKYGPMATKLLQESLKENPNNPRAMYLMGQNLYYTPPMWGGDKKKAMELMQKAKQIIANGENLEYKFAPSWGKEAIDEFMTNVEKNDDKED